MKKVFITIILVLAVNGLMFSHVLFDAESGVAKTGSYNDIRIPGDTGTGFSSVDDLNDEANAFFRFRVTGRINNRHNISGLVSFLNLKSTGKFDKNVSFFGKTFN